MPFQYDLIVIGAGPAGYSAAVTAAKLGARVCIVEKDALGGVCVNKGCIPTKTIFNVVSLYNKVKNSGAPALKIKEVSVDYYALKNRVRDVVGNITGGMRQLLKANKIEIIHGKAELVSGNIIKIENDEYKAKKIILAMGSRPKPLQNIRFDNDRYFSGEMFLGISVLPKSVLIAGAGIIGCEWAGILASLGVSVTLVEPKEKILPEEDDDLTRVIENNLKKIGVEIKLNTYVNEISQEKVIVCVGREPVTDGLDIAETKNGGWIKTDKYMLTSVPDVYAAGDITGPPLLAYKAETEGRIAAHNASGNKKIMDYSFMPRIVFAIPELASVGVRENEVENAGVARAFFKGLGRAIADGETEGFVKIIYNKSDYKLLGAGITGWNACELINEPALALRCGLTIKEWRERIWPHPVYSEIFGAALEKVK